MNNQIKLNDALAVVEEKRAVIARISQVIRTVKEDMAMIQASANVMIESGEPDPELMEAIHNKAELAKKLFSQIALDTSMD